MEQNSFIFQQATRIGMTHHDILLYVLANACLREKISLPKCTVQKSKLKPVRVIFGGNTSERQVSLMSGTNVWLKLRQSKLYAPEPYLLDKKGQVWHLPYTYALNHTVEEIYENCLTASATVDRLETFVQLIRQQLGLDNKYCVKDNLPHKNSLSGFLAETKQQKAFLFLGLHGGEGENGTLQQLLDAQQIVYNGSGPETSELCMNKFLTGLAVAKIGNPDILSAPKKLLYLSVLEKYTHQDFQALWAELICECTASSLIIKPITEGCSTGIVRLFAASDLEKYVELVKEKAVIIPANTFNEQHNIIEMCAQPTDEYLVENFVETDFISIEHNELIYKPTTGWLEFTCGFLEDNGKYHVLNPSITIAEGHVLSVEEKFQSGTGVNLTPPPEKIVDNKLCKKIKLLIAQLAHALGIKNYGRIDFFFNVHTGKVLVIEANTLPALTPSTVIYHQALAENPPMYPLELLEKIICIAQ
jgi:D-alanine-D-alanine ligase-like ATP-grasp enzyme